MREEIVVSGIILYTSMVGEYDKRLVVLTKERGKITVFANGSRRVNSSFRAAAQSFVMGSFTLVAGREAYNLVKADVTEYFTEISADIEKLCYASYFCEFMSYYTREGDFCVNHLNLLYFTLKALVAGQMKQELIRYIYELRLMDLEGQGLHAYHCIKCGSKEVVAFEETKGGVLCKNCAALTKSAKEISPSLVYTLQFIVSTAFPKLYSFTLSDEVFAELRFVTNRFRRQYVDKEFQSLEILSAL